MSSRDFPSPGAQSALGDLELPWPHGVGLVKRVHTRDSEQDLSEFRHPLTSWTELIIFSATDARRGMSHRVSYRFIEGKMESALSD